MVSVFRFFAAALFLGMAVSNLPCSARAQAQPASAEIASAAELPEAPEPQTAAPAGQAQSNQAQVKPDQSKQDQAGQSQAQQKQDSSSNASAAHKPPPEPKRILGLMPNYRAVSAGELPPPPTPRRAFVIATENSFDYSSFIFVGITSLLAEGTDAHPALGKGVGGYWGYYWRGYVDKTDGNYWVIWALPSVLHEDERYYAKGEGEIFKRGAYASTRVLITPNYHGHNTFNASEILGRGISNAISLTYYPSKEQTFGTFAEKYAYAVGRDALTNTFREFWPDIAVHGLHRHP